MSAGIITLTTDFGADSPYVSQVKAAILKKLPTAVLVDVTHTIAAQDIRQGAVVMLDACLHFPLGTVHMGVVDPGVGSERGIAVCRIADHFFVAPDNGLLSRLLQQHGLQRAVQLDVARFASSSQTFHGRDIMAPAAARIANGDALTDLGATCEDLKRLPDARLARSEQTIEGEVEYIDSFGNLITNIPEAWLPADRAEIHVACQSVSVHGIAQYFAAATPGALIALVGSNNRLEIAEVNGSAQARLRAAVGAKVAVGW